MSDAQDSLPVEPEQSQPRRGGPRRLWFPIVVAVLAVAAMALAQWLPSDRLDTGARRLLTFVVTLAALIAIAVWFFSMSGASSRAKTIGALAIAGLVAFCLLGIRRVEFTGDMEPRFDFRWTPDRMAVLEEHRTRQLEDDKQPPTVDLADVEIGQYDVLEYRGPRRDGVMPGPALARDWSQQPPQLVWRQPVGGGYASFLKIGPALVTIEQRRDKEAVVAYEADTGRELWVYDYPALFSETLGGDGPRATPTYHEGRIYSLGATGILSCIDFASGEKQWSTNILQDNQSGNLDWGMSGSPLIHDGLVIVNPGAQNGSDDSRDVVAYDAVSGKRQVAGGRAKAGYSSPELTTLGGVQQVLMFDGPGLAGFDPHDLRELWRVPWKSEFDINAAQPIVVDDRRVIVTSASGTGLVEVTHAMDRWSAEVVWQSRRLKGGYASPIVYEDHVYGIDESILTCIGLVDGKQKWKDRAGQVDHGQLLARDDLLIVLSEKGELVLVQMTPERYEELGRIQAIEGKTWNVPTLVGNRIFVRNHLEMAAYDLPLAQSSGESAEKQEEIDQQDGASNDSADDQPATP